MNSTVDPSRRPEIPRTPDADPQRARVVAALAKSHGLSFKRDRRVPLIRVQGPVRSLTFFTANKAGMRVS